MNNYRSARGARGAIIASTLFIATCGGDSSDIDPVTSFVGTAHAQSTTADIQVSGVPSSTPQRGKSGLGVNLATFAYWSPDIPLIDQFKRSPGWTPQCNDWESPECKDFDGGASQYDTKERSAIDLDEHGWVKSLPSIDDTSVKFRFVSTLLFHEDGGARAPGNYIVLYDGEGTLRYSLAGTKIEEKSRPGRDVVFVPNTVTYGLRIEIQSTNPSNYIRNIRLIPPGGVCADAPLEYVLDGSACSTSSFQSLEQLSSTETFHPSFLKDMSLFGTIRFVNWLKASNNSIVAWEERSELADATWSTEAGVPYELALRLSSASGADPWITLPPYIDDNHIREFARLAKRELPPERKLILEYGNELWNYAYPWGLIGAQFEQLARDKWPTAAAGLGLRLNWYAYRTALICDMVKKEFEDTSSRVICVLNSQAANAAVSEELLSCPLARIELGHDCAQSVDAIAIAPYFGGYIASAEYRTTTSAWAANPEWGLSMLFHEIFGTASTGDSAGAPLYLGYGQKGGAPKHGALQEARNWMIAQKQVADRHGLPMMAYEGGEHLAAGQEADHDLVALLVRANRDPRMKEAYVRYIQDWQFAGGRYLALYSHVSHYDRWGSFGLKEQQLAPYSPKWDAVQEMSSMFTCRWEDCSN